MAPTVHCALPTVQPPARRASSPHPRPLSQRERKDSRRGMTLVELLVVVTILMILTVVALPAVTPSAESRRIREAARSLNVFLGAARNRAMERQHPVAVLFQRRQGLNQACTAIFQAEVPPPYAGQTVNSRIVISNPSGNSATVRFTPSGDNPAAFPVPLVKTGDKLQLNYCGHLWEVTATSASDGGTWSFTSTTAAAPPVTPPGGLPYQFFRQPVPTMVAPLTLPNLIAVDTRWSGVGVFDATQTDTFKPASDADTYPIMVVFSPKGEVDAVWCWYGGYWRSWKATEPLYFLVGKRERVYTNMATAVPGQDSPAEDKLANWQDTGNLWVTVTPQTGLIKTVEVARDTTYVLSRRFAVTGQSMGGK